MSKVKGRNVTLTNVHIAYPHIDKPVYNELKRKEEYSACIVFDEINREDKQVLAMAYEAAGGDNAGFLEFLHSGEEIGRPEFEGRLFINATASTEHPPMVVDEDLSSIPASRIHAGSVCNVGLHFYSWEWHGRKGVSCGLDAIQLLDASENWSSRLSVDEIFA